MSESGSSLVRVEDAEKNELAAIRRRGGRDGASRDLGIKPTKLRRRGRQDRQAVGAKMPGAGKRIVRRRSSKWVKRDGGCSVHTRRSREKRGGIRRYEDASLRYTGVESHPGLTQYGLYDTVVARE